MHVIIRMSSIGHEICQKTSLVREISIIKQNPSSKLSGRSPFTVFNMQRKRRDFTHSSQC